MNRPFCCPEHCCTPVYQWKNSGLDITQFTAGQSFLCLGRMAKPVVFTYDEVIHANDLSTCMYSPLKGMIRFQENYNDWKGLVTAYTRALEKLDEEERGPVEPETAKDTDTRREPNAPTEGTGGVDQPQDLREQPAAAQPDSAQP